MYQGEEQEIELGHSLFALDSTTIDLCLSMFPWAAFRKTNAAIKMHTLLDLKGSIPTFISVTPAVCALFNLKELTGMVRKKIYNFIYHRLEHIGFHVKRVHYYSPIPDTGRLKDESWLKQSELIGIDIMEKENIQLLNQFLKFKNEYDAFQKHNGLRPYQYHFNNPYFGAVDAEVLYCMIRIFKPKRIIEIGSGYSTYLSAQAILKNEEEGNKRAELIAIEPFPNKVLRSGFPGLSKLIPKKVEQVDLSEFTALEKDDILFIDSSHVLKFASDVRYEYLEILPRLSKGVIIHIHDIFLPGEYPKNWFLEERLYFNEQYLLQAFMAFNNFFEVLWPAAYMHLKYPDLLERAFTSYDRKKIWRTMVGGTLTPGASSFWMRKVK